jgi:hypothetical protein
MSHDFSGRVGPPRCAECNATLNSDDRQLDLDEVHCVFCLECQMVLDLATMPAPVRPAR